MDRRDFLRIAGAAGLTCVLPGTVDAVIDVATEDATREGCLERGVLDVDIEQGDLRIELIDPENNSQDVFVNFWTAPLVDGEPARVTGWSTMLAPGPGGPTFDATLTYDYLKDRSDSVAMDARYNGDDPWVNSCLSHGRPKRDHGKQC